MLGAHAVAELTSGCRTPRYNNCQQVSQCSYQTFCVQEMARVCKPNGRILLLEHGRAGWDWLNGVLDRGESKHLRKWGCQWNRDIEAIVAQVRALHPAAL